MQAATAVKSADIVPNIARGTLIVLGAILLGETTINYIDRQVVSVLAPTLKAEFHWNNSDYALVTNAFLGTYAIFYSVAGWALDRLGLRRGLTLAVLWWSIAGALTSLSQGLRSMAFFRGLLAVGESGAWPAFAKAAATWVPAEARALFIGACNSGSSLGALIAPSIVGGLGIYFGWQAAFLVTGLLGFVWVVVFQLFMRRHPELAIAEQQQVSERSSGQSWVRLLKYRQTWAVFACRFFADPVWYFFLFWTPLFLKGRGLTAGQIALTVGIPYAGADIANFASGYLSLRLQRRGWSVNRVRKALMILASCLTPIGTFAVYATSTAWAMVLISIAIFFWMFWSVTVHALAGDYFPPREVGSVYGIAGTGSTIATIITTWAIGAVLDWNNQSYEPIFIAVGILMPLALLVGFSLMGQVEQVGEAKP